IYYNQTSTGRPASGSEKNIFTIPVGDEQTSLGNTSFYLDAGNDPLFPFGYVLSYTTFAYSNLLLSSTQYTRNEVIIIT
ncbi:glycosyl hydrolase, partial [Bacteroides cellulosilyticus]|nr:glycosyl hydrolase [Bacteroides cellulosilyticus]